MVQSFNAHLTRCPRREELARRHGWRSPGRGPRWSASSVIRCSVAAPSTICAVPLPWGCRSPALVPANILPSRYGAKRAKAPSRAASGVVGVRPFSIARRPSPALRSTIVTIAPLIAAWTTVPAPVGLVAADAADTEQQTRLVLYLFVKDNGGMHPPPFRPHQRLSDWPGCILELHCCKGTTRYPVRLLASRHGDCTFAQVLGRLRCGQCHNKPAPVYLCAGHREHAGGAPPDWAIELVAVPQTS